jgi:hypothetical protein
VSVADPIGKPHHDVEGAGAPVARGRADERDDLVLRSLHRLDLTNRGAQRSPSAEREHDRNLGREMRFQLPRGGTPQAEHAVLVGVTWDDLGVVQGESRPQGLFEFDAGADRVIDPERDQAIGDCVRDQALSGLARDVEFARQLVLGIACHVVQPRRACGEVALA